MNSAILSNFPISYIENALPKAICRVSWLYVCTAWAAARHLCSTRHKNSRMLAFEALSRLQSCSLDAPSEFKIPEELLVSVYLEKRHSPKFCAYKSWPV